MNEIRDDLFEQAGAGTAGEAADEEVGEGIRELGPCTGCGGEVPALAALHAELSGTGAALSAEAIEDAAFEAELYLADEQLEAHLAFAPFARRESEDEMFTLEEAFGEGGLEEASLEDVVALARRYPGLKITFSF